MSSPSAPALQPVMQRTNPTHFRGIPDTHGGYDRGHDGTPSESLRFRQLYTPREFSRVLHLREEIHLPAETLADPAFIAREKKETKSVS